MNAICGQRVAGTVIAVRVMAPQFYDSESAMMVFTINVVESEGGEREDFSDATLQRDTGPLVSKTSSSLPWEKAYRSWADET